jgi:hypothetical protein
MQYNDPMLGVAFIGSILMLAIFATLFPEKEEPAPKGSGQSNEDERWDMNEAQTLTDHRPSAPPDDHSAGQ